MNLLTVPERQRIFDDFAVFLSHLKDLDILDAYAVRPVVNGSRLSRALATRTGPWLKLALDIAMGWQLRHPDNTDRQGAIDEFLSRRDELGIR